MVCDITLRELTDGPWIFFMPAGGDTEPLCNLGGGIVAALYNPCSRIRSPMALWICFDGMKT